MFKKEGFTLAEVLITLGIIGVVAAMTIPTLLAKYQERQTVTRLKQTYSILSQAIRSVQEDVGTPDGWDFVSNYSSEKEDSLLIAEKILPALKVVQDCGVTEDFCTYTKSYKYLNNRTAAAYGGGNFYRVVLMNGTSLSFGGFNSFERVDFYVDINGSKGPNIIGKDLFCFAWFRGKGLYPLGSPNLSGYTCNKNTDGWGCTYYIMHYGNMNYLK